MKPAVTTRAYDNARSGANTHETELTPQAVAARGIRHLFTLDLPGDRRGCEAQPLIVPGIRLADGSVHDIVVIASMNNQVFAFDAETGARLWLASLGTPIQGSGAIDAHLVNDHWGVLSTPVIDAHAQLLYVCAWTSPDGSVAKSQHFVHVLSLATGHDAKPPLSLEGVSYNPGHGLPAQLFKSAHRKQRAALLLSGGIVFIGFGTIAESAATARGWLIAVDTVAFKLAAAWTSTSRGSGGGIWHSGAGPAADADGFIYVITGNGAFDGITDFSESIVKLRYVPAAGATAAAIQVVDWWTPWTDDGRIGRKPKTAAAKAADVEESDEHPMPTNYRHVPHLAARGIAPMDMGDAWADQDFGAGGPVLAAGPGVILAAGKDGVLYTANIKALGKSLPNDLGIANANANYAKLKTEPIFYTYYPGPQLDASPTDPTTLNVLVTGRTHHLHGTPVLWSSAAHGLMHYCWGENGNLRAWTLSPAGVSGYLACSAEVASPNAPVPPGGMPGAMITLSANGNSGGVVWASIPYDDANMVISPGRFVAYDAADFGTYADGSGSIRVLWDSQQWGWQFSHNKFNRPVVWNGRIYLPTYDASVWVLGLA